jgi:TonB-linked SusC/RagA family outer membrane protein
MKIIKAAFCFVLMWLGVTAWGQGISGVVTDKGSNAPVVGANVSVTGTTAGTITDGQGRFTLVLPAGSSEIQVSFIGYLTQKVSVKAGGTYSILLESDVEFLDEVVVVGYGTQKKASLTGAVSTVDVGKTLEARPITDVGRALQGTTPGLTITTSSGQIGDAPNIKIRGMVSTISGNAGNPLILVDNVEVPDITYINPDDIASISILKDASTTAIYGARAAFGAVLITTKKGSTDGKVKVTFTNNFAWATPTKVPEHTRADLNLQYSYDQLNALKTTPTWEYGQVGYYYNPDVIKKVKEWIDQYGDGKDLGREVVQGRDFDYRASGGAYFYRPWDIYGAYYKKWTPQNNQNIAISGGNEKTQYNLSASSLKQNGVEKLFHDSYKRLNTSGFISTNITNWLTVRGKYMYAKTSEVSPFLYASAAYDPMYYLYRWHNVYPYGTYNGSEFRGGVNDLKSARPVNDDTYFSRYTLGTTLNVVKGLTVDFDYTYAQTFSTYHAVGGYVKGIDLFSFNAAGQTFKDVDKIYTTASYDYSQYTSSRNLRNTFNGYITYDGKITDHSFKLMAGTNIEDGEYVYMSAKRMGVFDFDKGEVNLSGGDQFATSNHTWWSVAGFFGRMNYSFRNKYLLELDGRYDGSSKFAEDKRWAFFPSGSAAWIITEEPWMTAVKSIMNSLKIRGSYGMIGNQDVPLNSFISTLSVSSPSAAGNYWLINNNYVPYISSAPALVDPTLTWETVTTTDFGADARFLDNKLGITFDWYQRKTLDMLSAGEAIPSTVGASAPKRNYGELTTTGIELSVDYNHTFANGIHLFLSAQYTDFVSKITRFASPNDPSNSATYYQGKEMGEIWGYKTEGLLQRDDFVWANDTTISQIIVNTQSKNVMQEGVANQYILESGLFKYGPGDVKFKDLNGDGVIDYGTNTVGNPGDRTVIGNTTPRFQYGFRLGADWKGVDLSMFFQGVGRRSIWATGNMVLPGYYGAEANYSHTLDYWTEENTGAFYPRAMEYSQTAKWNYVVNDRYLLNVAYLRLKNLTIGYSFPQKWISKVNNEKLRVYMIGENLFEFDKMGGVPIDPEIDWTTNTSADSRSFGRSYPYRRTVSFGIQLEL